MKREQIPKFGSSRILITSQTSNNASAIKICLVDVFAPLKNACNPAKDVLTNFIKNSALATLWSMGATGKHCDSITSMGAVRTRVIMLIKVTTDDAIFILLADQYRNSFFILFLEMSYLALFKVCI